MGKNKPDVSDLKFSAGKAEENFLDKLGHIREDILQFAQRKLAAQPRKNVEVHVKTGQKDVPGILRLVFNSPNAIAKRFAKFRPFYELATRSVEKGERLTDEWSRMLQEAYDFLPDKEGQEKLLEIMLEGDQQEHNFTREELLESGVKPHVVQAYEQIRAMMEDIYTQLNDMRQHAETKSANLRKSDYEALAAKPFAQILRKTEKGNGDLLVTWRQPKTFRKKLTVDQDGLEKMQQDENVHVLHEKALDDGLFEVHVEECTPPLVKKEGYLPHFFHTYFILEKTEKAGAEGYDYKVVGSGRTLNDTVKKANALAEKDAEKNYVIQPKGFSFEGQDLQAAIIGDRQYGKMVDAVAKQFELSVDEARDFLKGKVKRQGRHRFNGSFLHRKGAEGYEQENLK